MDQLIVNFIEIAIKENLIDELDKIYISNRFIKLLNKKELKRLEPKIEKDVQLIDLLYEIVETAVATQVISDNLFEREKLGVEIMNLVTPLPSEVNQHFWSLYEKSPTEATDYLYRLGKQTNYIKTKEIARNKKFTANSEFGPIELTINLSKPEKDPQEIKKMFKLPSQSYPNSPLSFENEGFAGCEGQPVRSNLRIVRMLVNEKEWGLQYSPYMYYPEHCIFMSREEEPMDTSVETVKNLMAIVDHFPHYFVGANAGLPIVGGSILKHNHYQGGRYVFPIESAEVRKIFTFKEFPDVSTQLLEWPMTAFRLESNSADSILKIAEQFFIVWKNYTDESVHIYSETDGEFHNAITSIVRKNKDTYHLYLILRNNRTTNDFPDGIFHANPSSQHIKKENIGLIEAMGLAILPPRLDRELKEVSDFIINHSTEIPEKHREWAQELKVKYPNLSEHLVNECIQQEVGNVFVQILKDAGVFKLDSEGQHALMRFMDVVINKVEKA